jgi:hypothetical protein
MPPVKPPRACRHDLIESFAKYRLAESGAIGPRQSNRLESDVRNPTFFEMRAQGSGASVDVIVPRCLGKEG